jgi:hypothetical protein
VKILSGDSSPSKQKLATAAEVQRQADMDIRELRQSCVLLLHSMMEGQKKGDRVLKKLVELDATRVREEVVNIYQVRLSCHIASPPTTRHNHPSTNANSVPCRSNN